jgi:hypothetical protein
MRVSGRERIRIVRRRLARARLFSLCVVLAVFSVTSRIAFDADAIDLAARFFVFIGFGALRATVDHAVGLRCVSCCRGARALVRASPLVAKKNVACFSGRARHGGDETRVVYSLLTRGVDPLNYGYLQRAHTFLTDVVESRAERCSGMSGVVASCRATKFEVVWALEDDASVPRDVIEALRARGIIVVAHSVPMERKDDGFTYVPNFHFIKYRGFESLIQRALDQGVVMARRESAVFWRGSTTGWSCSIDDAACDSRDGCARLTRVRAVNAAWNAPWLDFRVTRLVQECAVSNRNSSLRTSGRAPELEWVRHKGILEVDGNVDAWGNRWRMESGSVVFMVKSKFAHYYSDALVDGVHYVGISDDLSDLAERTRIVTDESAENVAKLSRIASNAARLMREKYTYDKVVVDVADVLFAGNEPQTQ